MILPWMLCTTKKDNQDNTINTFSRVLFMHIVLVALNLASMTPKVISCMSKYLASNKLFGFGLGFSVTLIT